MTSLTVRLHDYTFRKLGDAARDAGRTPEAMAETALAEALSRWEEEPVRASSEPSAANNAVHESARAWTHGEEEKTTTISLAGSAVAELTQRARGKGTAPEVLIAAMLESRFFDYDDFIWANGDPRDDHISNHDDQQEGRPWSEVKPEFLALIDKTFVAPE